LPRSMTDDAFAKCAQRLEPKVNSDPLVSQPDLPIVQLDELATGLVPGKLSPRLVGNADLWGTQCQR
jgi:hypothetical protein